MRKQITLTPQHEDVVCRISKWLKLSQSSVINYAVYLLACYFGEVPEALFKKQIKEFYKYYVKELPRGKKVKGGKHEEKT